MHLSALSAKWSLLTIQICELYSGVQGDLLRYVYHSLLLSHGEDKMNALVNGQECVGSELDFGHGRKAEPSVSVTILMQR